jgi:uncharacterized membrane protein YfcA
MTLDAVSAGLLVAAGFAAGTVNAAAGGGSLISFPVLLLAGLPALSANVTNTVALCPGYLGGVRGYRRELDGQGEQMRRLGAVACGGAVVGVWLLAVSSTDTFRAVVPFLLILACVMIAAQQRVAAWIHAGRSRHRVRRGLDVAQFAAGAYGAYFGAGLGVMLLAIFGVLMSDSLQRLNALKAFIALLVNVIAAVLLILFAPVGWSEVLLVAPSSLVGGLAGARLARQVRVEVLRGLIVAVGLSVAVFLLLS